MQDSKEDMTIIPLQQGIYYVGADKQFINISSDSSLQTRARKGGITVAIQPFIIKLPTQTILIDAGISRSELSPGTPDILVLLNNNNIQPEEIDIVLISHLHYDHFTGLFHHEDNTQLNLPNATYYFQEAGVDFLLNGERYINFKPSIKHLLNTADHVLLNQEIGKINDNITYQATNGHTPHHISFWINNGNNRAFYGGDEAPQLAQMRMNYAAKYDYNGKEAMNLRKKWWEKGQAEKWTFLFYHDTKTPIFKAGDNT